MDSLLRNIKIQIPEQIFLKDPDSTALGKRIIENSIELIHELGFEAFTFKKLGERIGSPESTLYRYFENKHKLLVYLVNWYWGWLEYRLVFATANLPSTELKVNKAIEMVTQKVEQDSNFVHINEALLNQIVISESTKAFLTKEVDEENKAGYFRSYYRLCKRLSDLFIELKADFKYPNTLATTIIEGVHMQKFFSEHMPRFTDCGKGEQTETKFFTQMAFSLLKI
jgi:AcrR family transcriptional regulator